MTTVAMSRVRNPACTALRKWWMDLISAFTSYLDTQQQKIGYIQILKNAVTAPNPIVKILPVLSISEYEESDRHTFLELQNRVCLDLTDDDLL